jgi:cyclophilin family peptidyl-prolyl cis-trans isomerase
MRMRRWARELRGIGTMGIAVVSLLGGKPAEAQIGGCVPDLGNPIRVDMETSLGTIPLELFPDMAPITVQNFLDYMNDGDYDGALVHRSVPGFVIQGGGFREVGGAYAQIPVDPPIVNEPCLSNTRGTLAMARLGGQPDSATGQWFINLTDNPSLDLSDGVGFTAFGRVVGDGMAVADTIAALPIFDTLTILELPFNQVFRELPLQSLPVEPPEGYGCSRSDPLHGLADEGINFPVADPDRSGGDFVPILLDPQCTGSQAPGAPTIPCTPGVGRAVYLVDLVQQVFFNPPIPMTCDQVAESEASWVARRAGTTTQILAEDVEIITIPEPRAEILLAAGVAGLFFLARNRGMRQGVGRRGGKRVSALRTCARLASAASRAASRSRSSSCRAAARIARTRGCSVRGSLASISKARTR